MALEIRMLRVLDGPNIYQPQPGIALQLRSDKDRSRRLRDAVKEAAQACGLVIGFLDSSATSQDDGYLINCRFSTPQPALARDLLAYVVEGINRRLAGDEDWDADGPLFELQKRRRREAPSLHLLQVAAEARLRGLPVLRRPDGATQLGYGARSWSLLAGQPEGGSTGAIPWQQIGVVPLVALTGAGADACLTELSRHLPGRLGRAAVVADADFDTARAALCDQHAELVLLALRAEAIRERGLPFDHCAISAICDAQAQPDVNIEEDLLRALGVPMLVTAPQGRVLLNADEPALVELAGYAPCPLILCSAQGETALLTRQRASGGEVIFVEDDQIILARGSQRLAVRPLAAGPEAMAAMIALGVTWALGGLE